MKLHEKGYISWKFEKGKKKQGQNNQFYIDTAKHNFEFLA